MIVQTAACGFSCATGSALVNHPRTTLAEAPVVVTFPLITEHAGARSLKIAPFRFALVTRLERILFRRSVEAEQQEIPVFP